MLHALLYYTRLQCLGLDNVDIDGMIRMVVIVRYSTTTITFTTGASRVPAATMLGRTLLPALSFEHDMVLLSARQLCIADGVVVT